MPTSVEVLRPELIVSEGTVWFQANRTHGNMVPDLSEDWEKNRAHALQHLGQYTTAQQLVRMKPRGVSGFINLDYVPTADVHVTDGFFTTNPNAILHANPADCGEIAVSGFSKVEGRDVIGLFHASRVIVGEEGHIRGLESLCRSHDVMPEDLAVFLSPSARVESYKFSNIDEAQKTAPRWKDYVYQDGAGDWHVDFHGRTVDDILAFGVRQEAMTVSGIDTISHPDYFSSTNYRNGAQPIAGNGLFFALRGGSAA